MIKYALLKKDNIQKTFKKSIALEILLSTRKLEKSIITDELLEKAFNQAILSFINSNYIFKKDKDINSLQRKKKDFNTNINNKMLAELSKLLPAVSNSPGPAPNPTKGGGRGWFDWMFSGKT